jgi:hypothetical protein
MFSVLMSASSLCGACRKQSRESLILLIVCSHQQVNQIMDPVADSTYKNIWTATAKVSEMDILYLEVLVCSVLNLSSLNLGTL